MLKCRTEADEFFAQQRQAVLLPVMLDRMFVAAAEMTRPALCGERGVRRIGRHRASRLGDDPCSRIARSLSVSTRPR